ncbi:hypothetical protein D3C85_844180 [compost metagenome]
MLEHAPPTDEDDITLGGVGVRDAGAGGGANHNGHPFFGDVLVHAALDDVRGDEHEQVGVAEIRVGVLAPGDFQFDVELEGRGVGFGCLVEPGDPVGQGV